jgi:hypothetical protein
VTGRCGERKRKPRIAQGVSAADQEMVGWLMGLEPTTTGITILQICHSAAFRNVAHSSKNMHLGDVWRIKALPFIPEYA